MRRRAERSLPIQAFYSLPELADASGISRFKLRRMLESKGITFERSGRSVLVGLSELEKKYPELWDSIKIAASLRRAVGR